MAKKPNVYTTIGDGGTETVHINRVGRAAKVGVKRSTVGKDAPSLVQRNNAFGNDTGAAYVEFMRLKHLDKTLETELSSHRLGLMARLRKQQLRKKTRAKMSLLAPLVAERLSKPAVSNTRQRKFFFS